MRKVEIRVVLAVTEGMEQKIAEAVSEIILVRKEAGQC